MTARDVLETNIDPAVPEHMAQASIDNFAAEVLRYGADAIADMERRNAWPVRPVDAGICAEFLRGLATGAEGKSSRPADATPGLNARQARLLDAMRTWGGEWTTARALHLYALTDPDSALRATARRDLAAIHRAGHTALVDEPDNRHYVLHRKDSSA